MTDFAPIRNGETTARDRIPHLAFDEFRRRALAITGGGAKVVQYFAYADSDSVQLLAVLRTDRQLLAAGCEAPETYPALSAGS
jgi:hypothetical protein